MCNLHKYGFIFVIIYLMFCDTSYSKPTPNDFFAVIKKSKFGHIQDRSNKSVLTELWKDKKSQLRSGFLKMLQDHVYEGIKQTDRRRRSVYGDSKVVPTAEIRVTVMKRSARYWEPWELNNNICPPSLCTASEESRPRGTGGTVFYNGDIVLDKESEEIIYANSIRQRWRRRRKRATMRSSRLWPGGVVPYVFADDIFPKSKKFIIKAMAKIENSTCIRFRRKKLRDEDYVRFISEPGCWSNVGRVGGEQKISIGRGCERLGTAIHEISHALGFWHEQARPDRDKYVKIIVENISPRYLPDFDKANKTLVSSRGFPYDYESVMHYSEKAFTNLGEDTIKVIGIGRKLKMKIGQRDELSTIDIAQLRDMYNCNDKEDDNVTACPKGWKKNVRTCYKFESEMKEQFAGALRHCEKMNSRLLIIEDKKEDDYIKRHLKKKFPDVSAWRTAGRVLNGTFKWHTGEGRLPKDMDYTHWKKGHPSTFSSMALVKSKKTNRIKWEGVWLGSARQMPEHAYAFICERRARRKCLPGRYTDGRDYRGTLDHTIDGHTCQKWTSQYPHSHALYKGDGAEDRDGLGDHNYCRNPAGQRRSRPWCYTTKKNYKWQYCDVSICSASANRNPSSRPPSRLSAGLRPIELQSEQGAHNLREYGTVDKKENVQINGGYNHNKDRPDKLHEIYKQDNEKKGNGRKNNNNKLENDKRNENKTLNNGKEDGRKENNRKNNANRRKNKKDKEDNRRGSNRRRNNKNSNRNKENRQNNNRRQYSKNSDRRNRKNNSKNSPRKR